MSGLALSAPVCWYDAPMNAQLAELIELVADLPEVELAALVDDAKRRRANLRLVPPAPELVNRFYFIGSGSGGPCTAVTSPVW